MFRNHLVDSLFTVGACSFVLNFYDFLLLLIVEYICRYTEQDSIVDQVFPSVGTLFNPQARNQEYSHFCFWREPLAELGDIELED